MKLILSQTGQVGENDLSFLVDDDAKDFCQNIYSPESTKLDFKEQFKTLNPELVQLLEDLLQVNPYNRPTARECLKYNVFKNIK